MRTQIAKDIRVLHQLKANTGSWMQDISNRLHIFPEENTKEGPVSIEDNFLASIKQIELKLAFLNAQVEGRAKKEKESTREPPMAPISESNSPMVTEETLRKGGPDGNPLMGQD